MKKQLMIIGIIILLLTVGLSGYVLISKSNEEKIIGTWIGTIGNQSDPVDVEYTFFSDKTSTAVAYYEYNYLYVNSTWKITDNKLVISSLDGKITTDKYQFSNNDKTLMLTNIESNRTIVLTRE